MDAAQTGALFANEEVQIAHQISIREAGHNEFWLRDQIYENPAWLGLGELEALGREHQQPSGGRLDLLLKDPEDDSMYEVELMLGETDETHIIRTIEYWDNEKRRWPQRQHFAVLVAEHINRRFFNVIHLLSHSIPIVAIQASLLQSGSSRSLFFSKVLDTYEEVDDGTTLEDKKYDRDDWLKKAKPTLETADALLAIVRDILPEPKLNYLKYYVAINATGHNYFQLHSRSGDKSLLRFRIAQHLADDAQRLLDAKNISYIRKSGARSFKITVDHAMINQEIETWRGIATLMKKAKPEDVDD
jgi:hypothetical protein